MLTRKRPSDKKRGSIYRFHTSNFPWRRAIVIVGHIIAIFPLFLQPLSAESQNFETDDKTARISVSPARVFTGAYSVKEFGATGDGETLDMQAINEAIEACSESGGGTVLFPAGVYLTGTIHLKSNITLYLDAGATILGTKNLADYDEVTNPERADLYYRQTERWDIALIVGQELRNIAITGHGTIDCNKVYNPQGEEDYRGPHGIFLSRCHQILIQDIFIKDPGNYSHMFEDCSHCNIRGVTATGGSDAVHMIDVKDFIITDCHFRTGDDCIAGGSWENIVVSNCSLNTSCSGVRNFRGLKNAIFTNLVIKGPGVNPHIVSGRHDLLAGFLIHSEKVVDNLVISNISISNVRCPLWIGSRGIGDRDDNSGVRNVSISNLIATSVGMPGYLASVIMGTENTPVENISLNNVTIISEGGGTKDLIDRPVPPTIGDPYLTIPCYGLFCRDIEDLELNDVRLSYVKEDTRPALICEGIERLKLEGVRAQPGTLSDVPLRVQGIKTLISRDTPVLAK